MKKIIIVVFWSFTIYANAQPVGHWRDHFSLNKIYSCFEMTDKTIVGASKNGLVISNIEGGIEKLTKINGLSDVAISSTKYFSEFNTIVVGYENGNIDIIKSDEITNISDIKRKNLATDKTIYSIVEQNEFAYLACGFGIVKINVKNAEITDTYYIGENATFVVVNDLNFADNRLYAATNKGLYWANTNNFLSNFNSWNLIESPGYKEFTAIIKAKNNLFCIAKNSSDQYDFIMRNPANTWEILKKSVNSNSKISKNQKIYLTDVQNLSTYNFNGIIENKISKLGNKNISPLCVNFKSSGELLIGDIYTGVIVQKGNDYQSFGYNGVFLDEAVQVKATKNQVIATRGGALKFNASWLNGCVNLFKDNQWQNILSYTTNNYFSILFDPNKSGHYYIGSWGNGLLEYENNKLLNVYDASNSPLKSIFPNSPYIRISGIDYDKKRNIWMINRANENQINILKPDGNWQSITFNQISDEETGELKSIGNNMIWSIINNKGFFIINHNNTIDNVNDDIVRLYYPYDAENERIGTNILCFDVDKDGDLWFGTDEGVGVFYKPNEFNENYFHASRIKITALLGDSLTTNYLLKTDKITSMCIDDANRKWFGTETSGTYLMNSSGTKEILHFDTKNSPLPSNTISSIAIEPKTGEVFFVTPKGVVSYRADATEGDNDFKNVYVFPNPVRSNYTGIISITGLAVDVNVKITNIAGNLVYETTSKGGQASWNGRNFDGKRVATGIYLIFCANEDGTKSFVTKLLFIN